MKLKLLSQNRARQGNNSRWEVFHGPSNLIERASQGGFVSLSCLNIILIWFHIWQSIIKKYLFAWQYAKHICLVFSLNHLTQGKDVQSFRSSIGKLGSEVCSALPVNTVKKWYLRDGHMVFSKPRTLQTEKCHLLNFTSDNIYVYNVNIHTFLYLQGWHLYLKFYFFFNFWEPKSRKHACYLSI